MKLGISGQALSSTNSLEEIIQILKKNDIHNMEIWPENVPFMAGKTGNNHTYENKDIALVKSLLEKYDMKVACVTFGGAFEEKIVSDESYYVRCLLETVNVANELGAKVVNHYCFHISLNNEPDLDRINRYMTPALKHAENLGIILALENEAHDSTAKPDNMLKIIEFMNSDNFKTNFDATNYYHASEEGFPYAYEILKNHIGYVHIKNGCLYSKKCNYNEYSKGTQMGGINKGEYIYYPTVADGAVNIDGLLTRLKMENYKGYCVLEPHTTPDHVEEYYAQEVKYLRDKKHF